MLKKIGAGSDTKLFTRRVLRFSISQKLAGTVTVSVVLSGLLTGAVALRQDYLRYATSHRDSLVAAASAFSAAVSPSVATGDRDKVFDALRGIGQVPNFVHASVKNADGEVLSEVGASAQLDGDAVVGGGAEDTPFGLLTSRSIRIVVPVVDAGLTVGSVEVLSNADDLMDGLISSALMSLLGTAVALTVGLAIALRLQSAIVRPLKGLTAAMIRVRDHDLSADLPEQGDDEIRVLVAGYNGMLSNIRARDAQLVRHRDRLEQDVTDRTRDLASARDEAERANAAKSDFLATMSHEIRTPMSGMLVMAELLADGDLPARSRRYADVISQTGQSLLAIINDILDFAKIEAGKMDLEAVEVDLEAVVGTVLNLFHARAREKGLDLAAVIAADVPRTVTGDPVRLTQVVSNLVGNALKFTEGGSVTVEVSRVEPGSRVRIAVTDTGIGIPGHKLAAIFEAFGQADQSTTRQFGGTGLGLAIANRLVSAMGAAIEVSSQVGHGSTFAFDLSAAATASLPSRTPDRDAGVPRSVRLLVEGDATRRCLSGLLTEARFAVVANEQADSSEPCLVVVDAAALLIAGARPNADFSIALAEPDETAESALALLADVVLTRPVVPSDVRAVLRQIVRGETLRAPSRIRHAANRTTYPGARILAADDGIVNREVLGEALRRFDIRPTLVTNGAEALEAMQRERFDLVLMDGSMPVLDGFEACRRMRIFENDRRARRTPIVALTAHVLGSAAEAWVGAGMDGILHKPFSMADLDSCLARWLTGTMQSASDRQVAADRVENASDEVPLLRGSVLDDISTMSAATGGAFARRVFDLYAQHAPVAVEDIIQAATRNNGDDLAAAAHALKSMSHNVGAARVADICERLERTAKCNVIDMLQTRFLEKVMRETLDQLVAHTGANSHRPPLTSEIGSIPSASYHQSQHVAERPDC